MMGRWRDADVVRCATALRKDLRHLPTALDEQGASLQWQVNAHARAVYRHCRNRLLRRHAQGDCRELRGAARIESTSDACRCERV